MKFSYSWLKRHLNTTSPAEEIADGLTTLGLEVESCHNEYNYLKDFKVAVIESAEKHPNADKLKVCKVFDGTNRYNIVCGAPNARAGIKVVLATPGTIIPDTNSKLKQGSIRGVTSEAMMCSKRELKLGLDHDGIIELPQDAVLGSSILDALNLNDYNFDISLTPNRSDCFGVRGVAREAAALNLGHLKPLDAVNIKKTIKHDINIVIDPEAANSCLAVATLLIRGIRNTNSPEWLRSLLKSADIGSISAVVDVTNFINIDLCRPLHAYDAKRIVGDFRVRLALENEIFEDLKSKKHLLSNKMIVSSDDVSPLCLMGIIGGSRGCCIDETTDILLEAALFDPVYIANVGQTLNISTDSRTRFERGVDPSVTLYSLELAAELITEICGGEISEIKVSGKVEENLVKIPFSGDIFRKLSGFELDDTVIRDSLGKLGFTVDSDFVVTVPSYRKDISIKEDLVEEVLRIYGYNNVRDIELPIKDHFTSDIFARKLLVRSIRRLMCFQGLDETINYSFISKKQAELFGDTVDYVELSNPIAETMSHMRRSLIPGLVEGYKRIINKSDTITGLFEVGNVFYNVDKQYLMIAGLRGHILSEKTWQQGKIITDPYSVKQDLFALLQLFDISDTKVQVSRDGLPKYYHPGKSGALRLGPNVIGYFGQVHPATLIHLDVKEPLFIFECDLEVLFAVKRKSKQFIEKKFQNISRDFAFLAPKEIPAINFMRDIKKAHTSITDALLFDVYQYEGKDNMISLAVRVTIEQLNSTMSEKEIQEISNCVIAAIEKNGGELRQ